MKKKLLLAWALAAVTACTSAIGFVGCNENDNGDTDDKTEITKPNDDKDNSSNQGGNSGGTTTPDKPNDDTKPIIPPDSGIKPIIPGGDAKPDDSGDVKPDDGDSKPDDGDSKAVIEYFLNSDGESYSVKKVASTATQAVITAEYKGKPVTGIGANALSNCSSLTSVTIPDSIISIGEYAFRDCSKLSNVTLPANVKNIGYRAFDNCTSLATVNWNITALDNTGLYYSIFSSSCSQLSTINVNKNVTSILQYIFSACNFEIVNYEGNIASWCKISGLDSLMNNCSPDRALFIDGKEITGELVIPVGVTEIGGGAFIKCNKITGVTIQNGVTSIGYNAFSGCKNLTSVTIPDSVESMDIWAFRDCENLHFNDYGNARYLGNSANPYALLFAIKDKASTTFNVPESTNIIYDYAFDGCNELSHVTIPEGVTNIGVGAFRNCTSLTDLVLPDSVKYIWGSAFNNCSSITRFAIPDGVKIIFGATFRGCTSLTSITIPDSVTQIHPDFDGCNALEEINYKGDLANWCNIGGLEYLMQYKPYSCVLYIGGREITGNITIPEGVTKIANYAFNNCAGITSISLPESVNGIGCFAFCGCSGLTDINIPKNVTSIGELAFVACDNLQFNEYDNALYLGNENNGYFALIKPKNDEISSCIINENTKIIVEKAFKYCDNLTNLTIPGDITYIK